VAWLTSPKVEILLPFDGDAEGPGTWARLQDHLGWVDESGMETWVPRGYLWNGASIPRYLWTTFGHPLRNRYLRSSALHDAGCEWRNDSARVVHKRFYHGLREDGVPWLRANMFWRAVSLGGPRW
jgi:hypothetical protein